MCRLTLLSIIILAAGPALAADQVGQWYFTPQVGGVSTDNDRLLEDKDWLYGFSLGRHFSPRWSGELNFSDSQFLSSVAGPGGTELVAASADVLRVFNRDGRFAPYLTFGAGALRNDARGRSKTDDFMAQAGIGAIIKLTQSNTGSFGLRPEIKARWDDAGANGHLLDYIATLGLQFSFGPAPAVAAPVAAAMPPPTPPPPAPPPPPPPAPARPADSDGDGITDNLDRCPGTPPGTLVDDNGCPQRGSITLQGVNFELDSAQLTADSRPILAGVAADLRRFPRLRVELQGHTDSSGTDQYNLALSQRRADAVRDFLISEGVPAGQINARGYGEGQPVASNDTPAGRASNRRVVMAVLDNPGNVEVEGAGTVR